MARMCPLSVVREHAKLLAPTRFPASLPIRPSSQMPTTASTMSVLKACTFWQPAPMNEKSSSAEWMPYQK